MRSYDSRNDRVSARTRAVLATSSCSLRRARLARVRRSRLGCSRALDALCRARLLARRFFISRRQASRAFARLALDDDSPAATTSCSLRRRDLPQQPSLPRRCARAPTATGARHRSRNHARRTSAHRARSSTSPATPATSRAYFAHAAVTASSRHTRRWCARRPDAAPAHLRSKDPSRHPREIEHSGGESHSHSPKGRIMSVSYRSPIGLISRF